MSVLQIFGLIVVSFAGMLMGGSAWPMKLMKKYQFEHWWLISQLLCIIIIPWTITLAFCPHALAAYASIPYKTFITANLWALCWGTANLLAGMCMVRIGLGLTGAIIAGLGVSFGVTIPMVVKGSGLFKNAPDINSPAGIVILIGIGVMIFGVIIVAFAGFGRDRIIKKKEKRSGNFLTGLIMATIGGALSCGISLAFVYGQGPVVDAMKARGAGEIPSIFAVYAIALLSGGLLNIIYPAYLITKNKSWGVFLESPADTLFAVLIGIESAVAIAMMGTGMRMLGVLGASIGFGIQQASQMLGGQAAGFASGEWRGVEGKPRYQMYAAIALLIIAAGIMAYANNLPKL